MHVTSFEKIYHINRTSKVRRWFLLLLPVAIVALLIPWTQNIKAKGTVTTLYQDQRPQQLNSPIPGRISKWHVKNGDVVKKGDTILQLSEVKDEYFDPKLLDRTATQVDAKKGVREYYQAKVTTADAQLAALNNSRDLKLEQLSIKLSQLNNKVAGEQAELDAIRNEFKMAEDQYNRQKKMYDEGLVSLTQFQQRSVAYQNALAKKLSAENKLAQTQQEITVVKVEQNGTVQDYTEKLSKIQGERFQNLGEIQSTAGEIAKLENQITNYQVRQGLYYVLASQDGQITQLNKAGIGEILKDGESIGTIVPNQAKYAVEIYVRPVDLPLVKSGQRVMCVFDGFPAIVFSGWPNSSYGTFAGKVIAVENNIHPNGLFKALVIEEPGSKPWPPQIKVGAGVRAITILNDVPVWYELWRNVNGFPPDYYTITDTKTSSAK